MFTWVPVPTKLRESIYKELPQLYGQDTNEGERESEVGKRRK
jgi:hypothetical protein